MKKKIFILQEMIPNYRIPVFQKLSKTPHINLTVFYSEPPKQQKTEGLKNSENISGFKHIKLSQQNLGKHNFQFSFLKYIVLKRPDIVIAGKGPTWENLLFSLVCILTGIKWVWWAGGVPYIDKKLIKEYSRTGRLNQIFGKYNPVTKLYFCAHGMITYSEHAKNYFKDLGYKKNIHVAPNSPDTEKLIEYKTFFSKNSHILENLKKKYAPNGEKIIFTLGRLNRARKVDQLLQAFTLLQKDHPMTSLIIVGDGYEKRHLQKIVKKKKINNVHFPGAIYDDKILSQYFSISDIYVTPGAASLTLKMAMCFGKPVVSTAYGLEVHSIKEGENGFITAIDSISHLHDRIRFLIENKQLREKMGGNAWKTICSDININKMTEGFNNAIKQLC